MATLILSELINYTFLANHHRATGTNRCLQPQLIAVTIFTKVSVVFQKTPACDCAAHGTGLTHTSPGAQGRGHSFGRPISVNLQQSNFAVTIATEDTRRLRCLNRR
ncbi:multi-sensor signal transduction multi-kinase [Anopheles sinensis]|uniref:Multi-sensor signal transduction multi-kinase n=1 Tax=Anopheles sinensis TaxID=74873 RepID=A0A084VUI3_ANOSI|nr:multi-sensor signal transduction multi-kinase [Anopheles sinensis]